MISPTVERLSRQNQQNDAKNTLGTTKPFLFGRYDIAKKTRKSRKQRELVRKGCEFGFLCGCAPKRKLD
jgi:hypothetical protein